MKFVDEFRDANLARTLLDRIHRVCTSQWTIMEVCGGQTHSILRHGIDQALAGSVQLLHGPGCPVCVTPAAAIDQAIAVAQQPGVILTSFGDMLRVPGTTDSLLQAKSRGADVRIVYSPLDAVALACQHPQSNVIFFAVGFETTAPATALAVLQADRLGLANFKTLVHHVCVLPAMEFIGRASENRVQAFLAAGHVCTVTGYEAYQSFCQRYRLPVVVTGFEPVDLLQGILECVTLLETKQVAVINAYSRSVRSPGNRRARQLLAEVFETVARPWRGLGVIDQGGMVLRPRFARFDAAAGVGVGEHGGSTTPPESDSDADQRCRSGDVMTGRIRPPQCPHFGTTCRPQRPLGAPMVSSEGACAAYFAYQSGSPINTTQAPNR